MDEKSYADLVALSQFLPGPASSQVGIGIGVARGGIVGGFVSFVGFTLPSVVLLIVFAYIAQSYGVLDAGFIQGLKIVAVVVVAHAILGMAGNLTPDMTCKAIALGALVLTLLIPHFMIQIVVIITAAVVGFCLYRGERLAKEETVNLSLPLSRRFGAICLALFVVLLLGLPMLSQLSTNMWIGVVDSFYRAGALVFGGGHVVLPLLEREFVPTGLISAESFLAGYGAAQAVPGPLFTFAAYIGADLGGWAGGLVATAAIFLPAFLLILGALPFWNTLRHNDAARAALMGVNAAVVGILIAAFYTPIWTSAIVGPLEFAFAAILFFMLVYWKLPPWLIVLTGAIGGAVLL
ncbi:chromate transport protein ChrA [Geomicrobium sp. JCM 19037]|nr:chromate transport protein ChrA [Geomicrobium sp. JCM 19037]